VTAASADNEAHLSETAGFGVPIPCPFFRSQKPNSKPNQLWEVSEHIVCIDLERYTTS